MTPVRIARSLLVLTVLLTPFSTITTLVTSSDGTGPVLFAVGFALVQLSMAGMGSFLASRLPRHPIGWLLLAMGVGLALRQACGSYAEIGSSTSRGPLPGDAVAAWLGDWPFVPIVVGGVVFLLHLFPSGRYLSRRWRLVGVTSGLGILVVTAGVALKPGPLDSLETVENPFGATGWSGGIVEVVEMVSGGVVALVILGAVASMGVRTWRAGRVEREQIKWIMCDLALVALFIAGSGALPEPWSWASLLLALGSLAALPAAAAVAILRYRLYDIDAVINRALVYAALTATLAATYLGAVLVLQLVLSALTAGSGLAVAGSTLATAALVRPARARIQSVVDRRFFRSKYDAAQTLAHFGARVREEVDLDALTAELRDVVVETMQPSHLRVWTWEQTT